MVTFMIITQYFNLLELLIFLHSIYMVITLLDSVFFVNTYDSNLLVTN